MSKKLIFRILIVVALAIILIVITPFFFQDKLVAGFITQLNKKINAKIAYNDVQLSLIKNFPNATLSIKNFVIINQAPFKNDTLIFTKNVNVAISLTDLFKNINEKATIKKIDFDGAKIFLKVNKAGKDNYSITKKSPVVNAKDQKKSSNFILAVSKYSITNSSFYYTDKKNDISLAVVGFNHQGSGDFSVSKLALNTITQATSFSLTMQNIPYFTDAKINWNAAFDVDLDKMKFTFKKNNAKINAVNIIFDGALKIGDTYQDYNITFKSSDNDFKNVLSLIPSVYKNNFKEINATGDFDFKGYIMGKLTENKIPKFNISIKTKNASFKYPTLPKAITNITFDGNIKNTTGNINDMSLHVKESKFVIDKDAFSANGNIAHLTTNPSVNAHLKGTINLKNLSEAYPLSIDSNIKGILKTNFKIEADKKSIETNQYQNIKSAGIISLQAFSYKSKSLKNPVNINKSVLKFNNNTISLVGFKALSGLSDFYATGTLKNFYPFLFGKKELQGDFKINADKFVLNDFLFDTNKSSDEKVLKDTIGQPKFKIPELLNIKAVVKAKTVLYDNLTLNNVNGQLLFKDGKARFTNITANTLGGLLTVNGDVNTKKNPTDFDLNLRIKNFDIQQSFNAMETFQSLAPIAKAMRGKINSDFSIKGSLKNDLSTDLNSLAGDALANLKVKKINPKESAVLGLFTNKLSFLDISKLDLSDVKAALRFKDGKVMLKPVKLKWQDIPLTVSGTHSFTGALNYKVLMQLPAKYLGSNFSNLLSKLSAKEQNNITVPLTTSISGTYDNLAIIPNFEKATSYLTNQIIKARKEKLLNKGSKFLNAILSGKKQNDSISNFKNTNKVKPNDNLKNAASNLLNSFFKKKKDTTN